MDRESQSDERRIKRTDGYVPGLSDAGLPPEPQPEGARSERRGRVPKPARNRGRVVRRAIGWLLLLLVLGVIAYAAYIVSIVAKVSTNSWQFGSLATDASGRTNVLVLGVGDPGHAGQNLSDTIMVVSLDNSTHRVAQLSIPRDTRVQVPGYGSSKINAANAYGGISLAEQTVSNTLDAPMDYYVETNFSGLKGIVDAVGGVDVDVKDRLVDTEYPCDDNQYKVCGLDIEPGLQHMDGARALQYVRCRKGTCGNDFGRAARQQELIGLLKPKVLDPHLLLHPMKLTQLVSAVQQGVKTDLGLIQMAELANRWRTDSDNNPVSLVLSTAKGGYLRGDPAGSSDLLPVGGDFSAIDERFKDIFTTP